MQATCGLDSATSHQSLTRSVRNQCTTCRLGRANHRAHPERGVSCEVGEQVTFRFGHINGGCIPARAIHLETYCGRFLDHLQRDPRLPATESARDGCMATTPRLRGDGPATHCCAWRRIEPMKTREVLHLPLSGHHEIDCLASSLQIDCTDLRGVPVPIVRGSYWDQCSATPCRRACHLRTPLCVHVLTRRGNSLPNILRVDSNRCSQ